MSAQLLRYQPQPKRCPSTNRLWRQKRHALGTNVQDRNRESYHYGARFRAWYVTMAGSRYRTHTDFMLGYYVTVVTIEKLGRKWIQIQGFLLAALFRTCLWLFLHLYILGITWRCRSRYPCRKIPLSEPRCLYHQLYVAPGIFRSCNLEVPQWLILFILVFLQLWGQCDHIRICSLILCPSS